MITRRQALLGAAAMTTTAAFPPDLAARLDAAFAAGKLPGLHAVVLTQHGQTILERYYPGPDELWGRPLGTVDFTRETRHDLRSVSKSIVGLLYGIALAAGKVPPLDSPLLDAFPAYPDLNRDPARRQITIAHALSMTTGLDWNENLPYTDPANSEIAMENAADRYRYILSQPIIAPPGQRWIYSGGTTALLGHLISRGTNQPLHAYAKSTLFAPIGITETEWTLSTNGEAAAASGLRLRPIDLARIGQLLLDNGQANARQIVPADWLATSQTRQTTIDPVIDYGHHWYLYNGSTGAPPWTGAFGNGEIGRAHV